MLCAALANGTSRFYPYDEFEVFVEAAGFEILLDTSEPREDRLQELAAMNVHPQFADVPPEKLCVTTVDFIGRKPA